MTTASNRPLLRRGWTALLAATIAVSGMALAAPAAANEPPAPAVTVSPNADIDAAASTSLTITGTGFEGPGAANGLYVLLGPDGNWPEGTPLSFSGWLVFAHVPPTEFSDGAFSTTLEVPADTLQSDTSYVLATSAAHSLSATDRTMDTRTTIKTRAEAPAPTAGISVTPTTELADGTTVTVSGVFPATVTADLGPTAGTAQTTAIYLMYCAQPTGTAGTAAGRASGSQCDSAQQKYLAATAGPAGATVEGSVDGGWWTFSTMLVLSDTFGASTAHECLSAASAGDGGEQCGVFVRLYHGFSATPGQAPANLANPYVYDQFVPVSFAAPAPTTPTPTPTPTPAPTTPTPTPTPTPAPTTPPAPPSASPVLSVTPNSVDRSVSNTFTIRGSGYLGAGAAQGAYVSIGEAGLWQPGQVPDSGGWLATVHVSPGSIVAGSFAITITIPAGAFQAGKSYGAATFAAHGLALTNRTLDSWAPITLGGASTAGISPAGASRTPAPTPPALEGIQQKDKAKPTEGGTHTFTAGGFQPGETGVLVVLYSTPTVIDRNAEADENGVVTWTGKLPYGLSGAHTLTFQGSVSQGIPIQIAAVEQAGCTVEDAALTWGFKESFRSYISGSIAHGKWTVSDGATYETPEFGWVDGVGSYDRATGEGLVSFDGAIEFTGHGGILATTVADPVIEFTGPNAAVLHFDVSGTTQDGSVIDQAGVPFVELDLSAGSIQWQDGELTVTDAAAELTPEGAEAFGTYPAGEPFDPVTLTLDVGADCAATAPLPENAVSSGADLGWLLWLAGGVVSLGVAIAVAIAIRRRA